MVAFPVIAQCEYKAGHTGYSVLQISLQGIFIGLYIGKVKFGCDL